MSNSKTTVQVIVLLVVELISTPSWSLTINQRLAALESKVAVLTTANKNLTTKVNALTTISAMLTKKINTLTTNNTTLTNQIHTIASNSVLGLNGKLKYRNNTALFSGLNVQIDNGVDDNPNGLGNLILGFNRTSFGDPPYCSGAEASDQISCEIKGYTWGENQRSGSHYLIIGNEHGYTGMGGIIVGDSNVSNPLKLPLGGVWLGSSVLGGTNNIAGAEGSVVVSGASNTIPANGFASAIVSGQQNVAEGSNSAILGGVANHIGIYNDHSSNNTISGGLHNFIEGRVGNSIGGGNGLNIFYGEGYAIWKGGTYQ